MPEQNNITGFAEKVSRYFLDFLETDFKRQQAPHRRIQLQNDSGFRTAVPLRKYQRLYTDIWGLLSSPVDQLQPFSLPRSRYPAHISQNLKDLIRQHVDGLEASAFETVRQETLDSVGRKRAAADENPEAYVEDVQSLFVESVGKHIVASILALLDGPFRQQASSAIESVYDVVTDLVDVLAVQVVEQLPTALNTFIVSSDLGPTAKVLEEFFSEQVVKERIKAFFEDFATANAYQELRDLTNYMRLSGESLQMYLYVCELRFRNAVFPVFYIPATVKLNETNGALMVEFDPHLFIHKRAIDYIVQELGPHAAGPGPIDNRIIYLDPQKPFIDEIDRVLTKILPILNLAGDFDVRQPKIQTLASANLRLSKTAYFAVFDKSDESLLNDYEALLSEDHQEVTALFQRIIHGFLLDDPISARERVSDHWDKMPIPDRLVATSPIPLNEEQRKIIRALDDPDCRFIAIQGPPGTGKSHTITAIAFDYILNGKNILILSDKQEALDVVEDKLKLALASVRQDDDFPDPILRLGRTGNTYARLISQAAQERIRDHYWAARTHVKRLSDETEATKQKIQQAITQTIDAYATVSLKEVEELHQLEEQIEASTPGCTKTLQSPKGPGHLDRLEAVMKKAARAVAAHEFFSRRFESGPYEALLLLVQGYAAVVKLNHLRPMKPALSLFNPLGPRHQPVLQRFIGEYDALHMPLFGYLFRSSKLRELNARVGQELPCTNSLDLHKRLRDLRIVHDSLVEIKHTLTEDGLPDAVGEVVYRILLSDSECCADAETIRYLLEIFAKVVGNDKDLLNRLAVDGKTVQTAGELLGFVVQASRYMLLWRKVGRTLASAPAFDYVGSKSKLEHLYTTRMTHELDRRFVEFVEQSRTTAKTLGDVIKAKQQFPQEAFARLKEAFPCIIAGIREFAEYVPLQHAIFDAVVIDEASQVSVAQAFPALLRAKKVVVLGDQKQFSNVKAAHASIALNLSYLTDLDQYFREHISTAADKIQRLKRFDVKKSVLEFFDLIANYTGMLRKHFRGYQELISFSSKYFYGGQLQAIKVRGKPIEEVIEFSCVPPSDQPERYKNVNTPEALFIIERLREMIGKEDVTAGIITPFREQQQHVTKLIFADPDADRFEQDLRLKIMTFDSCQGEERDVIFYSMVATETNDALNYIFPVSLENTEERVEEALKVQRLNVGFSRAREKIHFILSKPVEQFPGAIGRVLMHYKTLLEDRTVPEAAETDPNSPMERKVLDWIPKTSFYQRNAERLELRAQFPIGDYLRQLDPTYQHPAYRCDFLLCYRDNDRTINIILEYDGFQEHFTDHNHIHRGNYDAYYRPEDIERQMVLESYGYKFLRINRFNLGSDPVATLSDRLYALIKAATQERDLR